MVLAIGAFLAAAVALLSVYVGASHVLGRIGALRLFVGYAIVIAAGLYAWHRFASKFR